jgi:Nucleotidyl transferase AbiEii toxin, Type IV TA system
MPVDEVSRKQVTLLIKTVPLVASETAFALKGGTAINLFLRDMPRLSVDIDLTYLPVADRESLRGRSLVVQGFPSGQLAASLSHRCSSQETPFPRLILLAAVCLAMTCLRISRSIER